MSPTAIAHRARRRQRSARATRPPGGVNFTAFESRLSTICSAFTRSAIATIVRRQRPVREHERLRDSACGSTISATDVADDVAARGTALRSYGTCPASMRLKFSRSLMMPSRCCWLRADALEVVAAARSVTGPRDPHREQLGVAADGVERRAQLVRHRREELALRAIRDLRLGGAARVRERALLGRAALGEVARDLREADELAAGRAAR